MTTTERPTTEAAAFGNCQKCGWTDMRVEYHDGRFDFVRDHYDPCYRWHLESNEHFRVTCRRCAFQKAMPLLARHAAEPDGGGT